MVKGFWMSFYCKRDQEIPAVVYKQGFCVLTQLTCDGGEREFSFSKLCMSSIMDSQELT